MQPLSCAKCHCYTAFWFVKGIAYNKKYVFSVFYIQLIKCQCLLSNCPLNTLLKNYFLSFSKRVSAAKSIHIILYFNRDNLCASFENSTSTFLTTLSSLILISLASNVNTHVYKLQTCPL